MNEAAFRHLKIRWTVGSVSEAGFEALRLSIHSAARLFGPEAAYVVCINNIEVRSAQLRTGEVPSNIEWRDISAEIPAFLAAHFDGAMAEGVGWKLAPLRLFPNDYELSLDNDCILWDLPEAIGEWLSRADACVMAEDAERCLGQFDRWCPPGAFNSGIRGLSPAFDFEAALKHSLVRQASATGLPVLLRSELDEQGLQTAALAQAGRLLTVSTREVTICSPFWPRSTELGSCGAHFVGLNARHLPWNYYDRSADACMRAHWERHRPALYQKAGLSLPAASAHVPAF